MINFHHNNKKIIVISIFQVYCYWMDVIRKMILKNIYNKRVEYMNKGEYEKANLK